VTRPPPERVEAHLLEHVVDDVRVRLGPTRAPDQVDRDVHHDLRLRLRPAVRAAAAGGAGIAVHAAACSVEGGTGFLLPGRTRSGKSTLALALAVERRATLLSDDVVRLDGRRAHGAGTPVSVRRDSPYWDVARQLWYADDVERLLVRPDDVGGVPPAPDTDVDIVVFPLYGRPSGLKALTPAAAFCRLASCLIGSATDHDLMALADLVTDVPAYIAGYGGVGEAIALLDEAIAGGPVVGHRAPPAMLSPEETTGFTAEIMGVRFGDEVAAFNAVYGEVVHFTEWPAGWAPVVPSWGALVGRRTDVDG
jgi:hypothetical protein